MKLKFSSCPFRLYFPENLLSKRTIFLQKTRFCFRFLCKSLFSDLLTVFFISKEYISISAPPLSNCSDRWVPLFFNQLHIFADKRQAEMKNWRRIPSEDHFSYTSSDRDKRTFCRQGYQPSQDILEIGVSS